MDRSIIRRLAARAVELGNSGDGGAVPERLELQEPSAQA